jgi:hypothetical protein
VGNGQRPGAKKGPRARLLNSLKGSRVVAPGSFLVPKKDGEFQLVVDYRRVNGRIVFDSYPLPTIDQALEQFGGAQVFCF